MEIINRDCGCGYPCCAFAASAALKTYSPVTENHQNSIFLVVKENIIHGITELEMISASIHSTLGYLAPADASVEVSLIYSLVTIVKEALEIVGATSLMYTSKVYIKLQSIIAAKASLSRASSHFSTESN